MILETVLATIRRHAMFAPQDRVLVAVSGGPDSVALLHILLDLRTVLPLNLTVAHLDHALRDAESKQDRAFVETLCRTLSLECVSGREEVAALARKERRSLEEAGRVARRRFLRRVARERACRRIALGHQRDDQAESVLLRLVAGAGRGGLSGIKPLSELVIARPLLDCGRTEILRYLEERGLEFRTDSSNADQRFPRNRMRHSILPLLAKDFNPRVVEAIARTADLLREEDTFLERAARRILRSIRLQPESLAAIGDGSAASSPSSHPYEPGITLDAAALSRLSPAVGRRVMRLALRDAGLRGRDLAKARIDETLQLSRRDETNVCLSLGELFVARLEYGRLILRKDHESGHGDHGNGTSLDPAAAAHEGELASPSDYGLRPEDGHDSHAGDDGVPSVGLPLPIPGVVSIEHLGMALSVRIVPVESVLGEYGHAPSNRAYLDADLLQNPLLLRRPRPGDRFRPLGAPGTRKLSDVWTDLRLPHEARRRCLLVESAGRIAWAVGLRPGHPFRVTDRTRRVAVLESLPPGKAAGIALAETADLAAAGKNAVPTETGAAHPLHDADALPDPLAVHQEAPGGHSTRPVLYSPEQIAEAVDRIAREVSIWAEGRELVLLGVLHGAFIFLSDLLRRLRGPVRVGFVDREGGLISHGLTLQGARVLVVEDILDTGESLIRVLARVQEHSPAEIRTCALFDKIHAARTVPLVLDYRGLPVPNLWVVGYGLDQDGRERNLPYLTHV